jgi:hypothetical protein
VVAETACLQRRMDPGVLIHCHPLSSIFSKNGFAIFLQIWNPINASNELRETKNALKIKALWLVGLAEFEPALPPLGIVDMQPKVKKLKIKGA